MKTTLTTFTAVIFLLMASLAMAQIEVIPGEVIEENVSGVVIRPDYISVPFGVDFELYKGQTAEVNNYPAKVTLLNTVSPTCRPQGWCTLVMPSATFEVQVPFIYRLMGNQVTNETVVIQDGEKVNVSILAGEQKTVGDLVISLHSVRDGSVYMKLGKKTMSCEQNPSYADCTCLVGIKAQTTAMKSDGTEQYISYCIPEIITAKFNEKFMLNTGQLAQLEGTKINMKLQYLGTNNAQVTITSMGISRTIKMRQGETKLIYGTQLVFLGSEEGKGVFMFKKPFRKIDVVDITISPEKQIVQQGKKAVYQVTIKDKHVNTCNPDMLCLLYMRMYRYSLSTNGLPFNSVEYPEEINIPEGQSVTVNITVTPKGIMKQSKFSINVKGLDEKAEDSAVAYITVVRVRT